MILSEQFISDMFDNQISQHIEMPQQVSLNFTVSSRSTKHPKKQIKESPISISHKQYHPQQTIDIANNQIANFNQWLYDTQHKFQTCYNNINALMLQIQTNHTYPNVCQDDILIIKRQVLKKDYQGHKQCLNCVSYQEQIEELERTIKKQGKYIDSNQQNIRKLQEQISRISIDSVKQSLIKDVQISLMNGQIKDLNNEINTLKNEKSMLERTFLFNKTRNSQLNLLQKSKSLSAAKNSTNSSDLNMIRNHQTIIFIDPIQSDVDQWIRFFQQQKNRYLNLLKKEQMSRSKDLTCSLNRQEKFQENENKLNILHHCLKEIHSNLLKIRQKTNQFHLIESNKYGLRQKIINNNQSDYYIKKQQTQKLLHKINDLKLKLSRSTKINTSLLKQKNNIQEINQNLKEQRRKENNQKHQIYQLLLKKTQETYFYQQKYLEFKQKIIQMTINLQSTEALIQEITNQLKSKQEYIEKYSKQQKYFLELQKQMRKIESQVTQNNKGHQVQINSLVLKLKKDCFQRKRIYSQLQELKGNIRLYCRIIDNKGMNQMSYQFQDILGEIENQKIYNKLFYGQNNSQEKVYEDIKKLVCGAFDGYHLTLLSYSHAANNKSYTMHGTNENPGIIPRVFKQIFKYIQGEKQFMQVQVSLNVLQFQNDKFIGLLANEKLLSYQIKENQQGNVYLANYPQFTVENHQELIQLYQDALSNKKIRQKYKQNHKSHFIMTINLQISNKKTQQIYKSKIHLIQLAELQKINNLSDLSLAKEHNSINKSISYLFNTLHGLHWKQKVNFRQNKLTHYLKDSFSSQNKTILLFTFNSSELIKEENKNMISFASKFRMVDKNQRQNDKEEQSRHKRSISRKNI